MVGASFRFDHLVIAVLDLQVAIDDYTQLGFKVTPGGRHTHAPTRNALIYFRDGAYIELIEWLEPAPGDRWYERVVRRGEGIIDFALCPTVFPGDSERVRDRYRSYGNAIPGSRIQADGEEIRWMLGWPNNDVLPFMCADVTPRARRVPQGECCEHPNGAGGVTSLSMEVHDLDAAVNQYERLLACNAMRVTDDESKMRRRGLRSAELPLGTTRLHLIELVQGSDAARTSKVVHSLAPNEPRISRATLTCDSADSPYSLDTGLAHGAEWSMASKDRETN